MESRVDAVDDVTPASLHLHIHNILAQLSGFWLVMQDFYHKLSKVGADVELTVATKRPHKHSGSKARYKDEARKHVL